MPRRTSAAGSRGSARSGTTASWRSGWMRYGGPPSRNGTSSGGCSTVRAPTAPCTRSGTRWSASTARTANRCSSDHMTAFPLAPSANAVRDTVRRLAAIHPGPYRVVSCYLKLEPRDKTRGKYLIKMKNRVRQALATLDREGLERAVREQVEADLEHVRRYFEEPAQLPRARGIALFACRTLDMFDVIPLPHVYRSRLAVEPVPLVRELIALEREFGVILVAACDRTGARFFEVTAFDVVELPSLIADATRTGKFHGARQAKRGGVLAGGFGEHNHHMRIREEKHRLYANVADHIYQIHTQRPLAGLVVAGVGVGGAAPRPPPPPPLHALLLGGGKLHPKKASPAHGGGGGLFLPHPPG